MTFSKLQLARFPVQFQGNLYGFYKSLQTVFLGLRWTDSRQPTSFGYKQDVDSSMSATTRWPRDSIIMSKKHRQATLVQPDDETNKDWNDNQLYSNMATEMHPDWDVAYQNKVSILDDWSASFSDIKS